MESERTYEVGTTMAPFNMGRTMMYGKIYSKNTQVLCNNYFGNLKQHAGCMQ